MVSARTRWWHSVAALPAGLVLGLGLTFAAIAASNLAVDTNPASSSSTGGNVSSTITAGPTFQVVFTANVKRRGCTIQNNGTHSMYVSEGLGVASSTTANSAVVAAGNTYYCVAGGIVLTGEIDITGTTADAFYAAQY